MSLPTKVSLEKQQKYHKNRIFDLWLISTHSQDQFRIVLSSRLKFQKKITKPVQIHFENRFVTVWIPAHAFSNFFNVRRRAIKFHTCCQNILTIPIYFSLCFLQSQVDISPKLGIIYLKNDRKYVLVTFIHRWRFRPMFSKWRLKIYFKKFKYFFPILYW